MFLFIQRVNRKLLNAIILMLLFIQPCLSGNATVCLHIR